MDQLELLETFRASLKTAPLDDRDAFKRAIAQAPAILGVSQAEIASWFHLSRATVNRWATGAAAPYPGLRKVVLHRLARRAADQRQKLQDFVAATAAEVVAPSPAVGENDHEGAIQDVNHLTPEEVIRVSAGVFSHTNLEIFLPQGQGVYAMAA